MPYKLFITDSEVTIADGDDNTRKVFIDYKIQDETDPYIDIYAENNDGLFSNVNVYPGSLGITSGQGNNYCDLRLTPTGATIEKGFITKPLEGIRAEDNFSDDAAAATGGVAVGGLYHTNGAVKVRLV